MPVQCHRDCGVIGCSKPTERSFPVGPGGRHVLFPCSSFLSKLQPAFQQKYSCMNRHRLSRRRPLLRRCRVRVVLVSSLIHYHVCTDFMYDRIYGRGLLVGASGGGRGSVSSYRRRVVPPDTRGALMQNGHRLGRHQPTMQDTSPGHESAMTSRMTQQQHPQQQQRIVCRGSKP